jgi:tetratricopeptide (TPR) repeat protein
LNVRVAGQNQTFSEYKMKTCSLIKNKLTSNFGGIICLGMAIVSCGDNSWREHFRGGGQAEKSGDIAVARVHYIALTQLEYIPDGNMLTAYEYLGRCEFLLGNYKQAVEAYDNKNVYFYEHYSGTKNNDSAKRSKIALRKRAEGNIEEYKRYCEEIISVSLPPVPYGPQGAPEHSEAHYFRGSAEGFARLGLVFHEEGKTEELSNLVDRFRRTYIPSQSRKLASDVPEAKK